MKTTTRIALALIAILSLGVATASAGGTPSGLSAHISTVTNRVGRLSGLEFLVVLTNSGPTNVTIYPDCYVYGHSTITVFDPQGRMLTQRPGHLPRTALDSRALKPGESFTFTNKLGDIILYPGAVSSGKYRARYGGPEPSNEVEITME